MAGKHDVGHSKHNGVIGGSAVPRVRLGVPFAGRMNSHSVLRNRDRGGFLFGPPQRTVHVEFTIAAIYS